MIMRAEIMKSFEVIDKAAWIIILTKLCRQFEAKHPPSVFTFYLHEKILFSQPGIRETLDDFSSNQLSSLSIHTRKQW
jgi:hypothetical protein